ncbi:L,D-transpeptidase [bacterium]|nr:L,D-transpeptidase [bacterium]
MKNIGLLILSLFLTLTIFGKTEIIVIKSEYKLYLYIDDKVEKVYEIGLSQSPIGDKQIKGDNKMPEGVYYIVQKAKGPFEGKWGAYLGKRWLRVSYPNSKDAKRGLKKGIITQKEYDKIVEAEKKKIEPPKNTALGGGIGIHGWIEEDWDNNGDRDLTWGCIVMHNKDIEELYDKTPLKTKLVIKP